MAATLLFPLLLLVVPALLLGFKRTRVAGLVLLGVLLAPLLFKFVAHAPTPLREAATQDLTHTARSAAIWSQGVDRQFRADIYPGRDEALAALGRDVGRHLAGLPRLGVTPVEASERDLPAFRDGLSQAAPGVVVRAAGTVPAVDLSHNVRIRVTVTAHGDAGGPGRAQAEVAGIEPPYRVEVGFVEKPWLSHSAIYLNEPAHRDHRVVTTGRTCTAADEAQREAEQAARRAVEAVLRDRFGVSGPVSWEGLQQSGVILDRFIQRFEATAGPLWRQALLLDLSGSRLDRLVQSRQVSRVVERRTWASLAASALGLGFLILGLYTFLNAATRGYYTWALRIVLAILGVALVVILVLLWA